jgi:hypothetical protein
MDTHRFNGGVQLNDVIIQIMFEPLWRKLEKIIERLGRLVEP